MKKLVCFILAVMITAFLAAVHAEASEQAINRLKEHCYINPTGGERLHTDQNCRSVHEKNLPLTEVEFSDELLKQYSLCPVCTLADEPQEEPAAPADPALVISEAELNRITAEWEEQYGDYRKWDYQVNAAFVSEAGTLPDTPYVFDKSVLPIMPDEDAIPAEEIAGKAIPLAASYGSRLTEDVLKDTLAQKACKHAVKGGDDLTKDELVALIKMVGDGKLTMQCPHGRPFVVEIKRSQVDKWFKRTL